MERGVVDNKALEEFRERLLRWDELCTQHKELYYRYLDLAAFRSDKCYFPGRKCRRSWDRRYDMGDLTLMWTYITNTAPLCGKLIRALAEVEYKARLKALESLEKYGGVEKKTRPKGRLQDHKIEMFYLNEPVYVYLALWDKWLYVIWGEFDSLPRNAQLRTAEIGRRVIDVIERYKHGEKMGTQVEAFEVDDEYRRLWLETPLPESVSKLLGGRNKAPIALFRNLGWLLSDDSRQTFDHIAGIPGQVAVRLFDWIALMKYAIDMSKITQEGPLIFKLKVRYITRTKNGNNPLVAVRPIGISDEILDNVYGSFGIRLGTPEGVLTHGYAVVRVLKEEGIKKEGRVYVVDSVGAWIAFSNAVAMLIIGDGSVASYQLRLFVKSTPKTTLEGRMELTKELAEAVGGIAYKEDIRLQTWHMRLLLPTLPTPAFEKVVKLYKMFTDYPASVTIKVDGVTYLLHHSSNGEFAIGEKKGAKLRDIAERLGIRVKFRFRWGEMFLTHTQLKVLSEGGIPVKFLNDLEKDLLRKAKPILPPPSPEVVVRVLEEVAKIARIAVGLFKGRRYIRIILYDKSRISEVLKMLESAEIRFSVLRRTRTKEIRIYDQRTVDIILRNASHLLQPPIW